MSAFKYFFLNEHRLYRTGDKLRGNPRIIKFDLYEYLINGFIIPSPAFDTLADLVKSDKRFMKFKKDRPRTALLLMEEENIVLAKGMIMSSKYDNEDAAWMLMHLVEGNRKAETFSGIHYIQSPVPDFVRNFAIIDPPDMHGVYTASFEVMRKGKLLKKENVSTMFPQTWSLQQLYEECLFALDHKENVTDRFFKSKTRCGISVEIYYSKDLRKIHTLYPVRE